MSYWSSVRVFIFSSVSVTTSFQASTRSRYLSRDWFRNLMEVRWFWTSRITLVLVALRVAWSWVAWSRTWTGTRLSLENELNEGPNRRTTWCSGPAPVPVSSSGGLRTLSSAVWSPHCTESRRGSWSSWWWSSGLRRTEWEDRGEDGTNGWRWDVALVNTSRHLTRESEFHHLFPAARWRSWCGRRTLLPTFSPPSWTLQKQKKKLSV